MSSCPAPFLVADDFPVTGGDIEGRLCYPFTGNVTCCLPCPTIRWVYSGKFDRLEPIAGYTSIVTFVCSVLLLLTFAALPEEQSHRHYLSVGLTGSLVLLSLAFIIPLGTKPDQCHNAITPNNLDSDMSCAWTGALFEIGAMGAIVWILLRAIWTSLRIVWDFKRLDVFKWVAIAFGVGLPALFLAVSLPLAGASYPLGHVCLPTGRMAFPTFFVWLLAFGMIGTIIQGASILWCLWKFALCRFAGADPAMAAGATAHSDRTALTASSETTILARGRRRRRVEWRRVKKVLALQWRSIALAFFIGNESIFLGVNFAQQTAAAGKAAHAPPSARDYEWAACLVDTHGDSDACLALSPGIGLNENRALGTLILASLIGVVVFSLLVRPSMFVGWYELLRHPRRLFSRITGRAGSVSSQGSFIMSGSLPKHMSLTKPLASDALDLRTSIAMPSELALNDGGVDAVEQGKQTITIREDEKESPV